MKAKKFMEKWEGKNAENNLLRLVVIVLVTGLLVQSSLLIYMRKTERTVIVPSYIDRKFYVEGSKVSPEYLEMMSKYAVELLANYTPETIKDRYDEFLRFIAPSQYNTVSSALLGMINDTTTYRISQYFIPQDIKVQDKTITIVGLLRKYVQDKELNTYRATYKMEFHIENGRFLIDAFNKIEDTNTK